MRAGSSIALGVTLLAPSAGSAQTPPDTTIKVTYGGFVDSYYAYDFGRPKTFDRSFASGAIFTTQPARHDEFNVNLAYLEASFSGNHVHGRLALQAGTSVQSNYLAEPTQGTLSGGLLSRHLQEAYAGYQVTRTVWIDGGIFYSHMGAENWASKDNPTYTRSLVSDYSPYYSAGVRAVWSATSKLTARLDVINGWQNISETNTDKGAGIRLDYAATPTATVSYYNLFNNEVGGRFRVFNGVSGKGTFGGTTLLAEVDVGSLSAPSDGGNSSSWWGMTAVARQVVAPSTAVAGRFEWYEDPDQVNIATGLDDPYRGPGVSFGVDVVPLPRFMWRSEIRGFFADEPIFWNGSGAPKKSGGFFVSSVSMSF
jgi:hypothetical protein